MGCPGLEYMVQYLPMSLITNISVQQLRQAADLKEKIAALENQLSQLLGSTASTVAVKPAAAKAPKKKGGMSAAGKARIVADQKARWAKIKAATESPASHHRSSGSRPLGLPLSQKAGHGRVGYACRGAFLLQCTVDQ